MDNNVQQKFSKVPGDYNRDLPAVVFDLDDTLGQMHHLLIEHACRTHGVETTSERWQSRYSFVDLAEFCGVDVDTFYHLLEQDPIPTQEFKVHERAAEFICGVRKHFRLRHLTNVNVHVVTSRGAFWRDHTPLILETVRDLPIDGIHVIDKFDDKVDWCIKKFGKVLAVFEDSPKAIDQCLLRDIPVYVSSLKYNMHYNLPRFCLWQNDFGDFNTFKRV